MVRFSRLPADSIISSHRSYRPSVFTVCLLWFFVRILDRIASTISLNEAPHSTRISSRSCLVKTSSTFERRGLRFDSYTSSSICFSFVYPHPSPTGAPEEQLGLLHKTLSYSRTLTSWNLTRFGPAELLVEAVTEPMLVSLTPRALDCSDVWGDDGVTERLLRRDGALRKWFRREIVVAELPDSEASLLLWKLETEPCFLRRRASLNILIAMERSFCGERGRGGGCSL
mmetsp:Transcript_1043/g.2005  ORF Transcript_1043/g.2005 Transcript_1043/m.2005 type:complete len:228 (-) Transcript_1043:10-693(-)